MNAHTKGPWTVQRLSNGSTLIQLAEADIDVCQVFRPYPLKGEGPDTGERQAANASLIAAAPELLEALEALVTERNAAEAYIRTLTNSETFDDAGNATPCDSVACLRARNAIAKAKGQP